MQEMLLKGKIGIYLEKTYFAFKIGSAVKT